MAAPDRLRTLVSSPSNDVVEVRALRAMALARCGLRKGGLVVRYNLDPSGEPQRGFDRRHCHD